MTTDVVPALWSVDVAEVLNVGIRKNYSFSGGIRLVQGIPNGIRIVTAQDGVATVLEASPVGDAFNSWGCSVWVFETSSLDEESVKLAVEITVRTQEPTSSTVFESPYANVKIQSDFLPPSPAKKALLVLDTFSIYMATQQGRYEFRMRHGLT